MNQSSIYADLRRFAGPIKAKKLDDLAVEPTPPRAGASENTLIRESLDPDANGRARDDPGAARALAPELTIEDVAALVSPPFAVLRDASGAVVNDITTLAIRCEKNHLHKYFTKDIAEHRGLAKCTTCASGNKFMVLVRETAESALGCPFVVAQTRIDPATNGIEFTNPRLKLTIMCDRAAGVDSCTEVAGRGLLVTFHPTTSKKKINDGLFTLLSPHATMLPEDVRACLMALGPKPKIATARPRKTEPRAPLPYTADLAAMMGAEHPPLNIVDEAQLCLENC